MMMGVRAGPASRTVQLLSRLAVDLSRSVHGINGARLVWAGGDGCRAEHVEGLYCA
jgi:hypothetical protein